MSTVETPSEPTTPLLEPSEDYDDIDKVRDDLQSTKQLLEIELKNKAKADEENARLMNEIRKLREELSKRESNPSCVPAAPAASSSLYNEKLKKSMSRLAMKARKKTRKSSDDEDDDDEDDSDEDSDMDFGELEAVEEELNNLRGQAELAKKTATEFESKYKEVNQKLVTTQAEMEDLEIKVAVLSKKLKRAQAGGAPEEPDTCDVGVQTDPMEPPTPPPDYRQSKSHSKRDLRKQMSRQESKSSNVSQENNLGEDETGSSEESEEEEDETGRAAREQKRELSLLNSRLRSLKDKEKNVKNERVALRLQMKKFRSDLKEEKKK